MSPKKIEAMRDAFRSFKKNKTRIIKLTTYTNGKPNKTITVRE